MTSTADGERHIKQELESLRKVVRALENALQQPEEQIRRRPLDEDDLIENAARLEQLACDLRNMADGALTYPEAIAADLRKIAESIAEEKE